MSRSSESTDADRPSGPARRIAFGSGIFEAMPTFREPPSFPEWFGARLASRLLWVICGLAVVFLVVWWATRPTLVEVRQWLGVNVASQELLTHARNLQQDHFDQFRDLFQLIVMSGLIPLFTLLAGYAFGARQREKQE